uniref:R13L1/DRL21-like LRR repeat region domain-containing protein n=1 Tax=Nelumbo nucifera TaxID=4432 RepID=A0A822YK87_NELNU|nr:TPA_asm: hypothetical protein HUJ06_010570 [Nelumbo nucifera]
MGVCPKQNSEIAKLENVSSAREAKEANIEDRQNIQRLDLVWSSWCNLDTNTIDDDNDDHDVLKGLQPHPNLKGLQIAHFKGTKFPLWMIIEIDSFLPNLVETYLIGCRRLENVPMFGYLPLLRDLFIEGLEFKCIQFYGVVNNSNSRNAVAGRGGDHGPTTVTLFPLLKHLWPIDMPNLVEWKEASSSCSSNSIFPCLEQFTTENCPKLNQAMPYC